MPKLDAIGIIVANVADSVRFYELLGLKFENLDGPHVEAKLPNGVRLMLDSIELARELGNWIPPIGHRMSLAFLCESPDDVDATHAKTVAAGYRSQKEPWDAFWGQRYAQLLDPDDNILDLFAPLPASDSD